MTATQTGSDAERRIWEAIGAVTDPEIPVLSVVDLGIIDGVSIADDGGVVVRMLPTFVGCPALSVMREQIAAAVHRLGHGDVRVDVVFDPPWSSDRITEDGRRRLREFGLAPPAGACGGVIESNFHAVPCPWCGSRETDLESIFGPTLCRSMHYCRACRQSFEHFKPVG